MKNPTAKTASDDRIATNGSVSAGKNNCPMITAKKP